MSELNFELLRMHIYKLAEILFKTKNLRRETEREKSVLKQYSKSWLWDNFKCQNFLFTDKITKCPANC